MTALAATPLAPSRPSRVLTKEFPWSDTAQRAPLMVATMHRYLDQLAVSSRPTTVSATSDALRFFAGQATADDPTRYVDPAEELAWVSRDPLIRYRAWMRSTGRWDDAAEAATERWCEEQIDAAVQGVAAVGPADPRLMFDNLYEHEPVTLTRQRDEMLGFVASDTGKGAH